MANDGAYHTNSDVQFELNSAKNRIKVGDDSDDNITEVQIQTYMLKVEGRFLEDIGRTLSLPLSTPVEFSIDEALISMSCYRIYRKVYRPSKSDGKSIGILLDAWEKTYNDIVNNINNKKLKLTNNSYRSSGKGSKKGNAYNTDSNGDIYSDDPRSNYYDNNPS